MEGCQRPFIAKKKNKSFLGGVGKKKKERFRRVGYLKKRLREYFEIKNCWLEVCRKRGTSHDLKNH